MHFLSCIFHRLLLKRSFKGNRLFQVTITCITGKFVVSSHHLRITGVLKYTFWLSLGYRLARFSMVFFLRVSSPIEKHHVSAALVVEVMSQFCRKILSAPTGVYLFLFVDNDCRVLLAPTRQVQLLLNRCNVLPFRRLKLLFEA